MEPYLDIAPSFMLDINYLSDLVDKDCNKLMDLTFHFMLTRILGKNLNIVELLKKSILKKYFNYSRVYCPLCLKENSFYKLLWQIKDIDYCYKHHVKLLDKCPYCKNPIAFLTPLTEIGKCDKCFYELSDVKVNYIVLDKADQCFYKNWLYIVETNKDLDENIFDLIRKSSYKFIDESLFYLRKAELGGYIENSLLNFKMLMNILKNSYIFIEEQIICKREVI